MTDDELKAACAANRASLRATLVRALQGRTPPRMTHFLTKPKNEGVNRGK